MDVIETFKVRQSDGAIIEIRRIQTHLHFEGKVLNDGIIYLAESGEKALPMGERDFVIVYLDRPHAMASRID